jgi:hypothetical protein
LFPSFHSVDNLTGIPNTPATNTGSPLDVSLRQVYNNIARAISRFHGRALGSTSRLELISSGVGTVPDSADLTSLRAALKDGDPFVRAIAAYALGVRKDKTSADALAELVKNDKEYVVRIRAVEALGLLNMKAEVIESALKDRDPGVPFVARLVAGQVTSEIDYAAEIRQAYAAGIDRGALGSAVVGKPAPDFTALTIDGEAFQLSPVLGKKPTAVYFTAFDG